MHNVNSRKSIQISLICAELYHAEKLKKLIWWKMSESSFLIPTQMNEFWINAAFHLLQKSLNFY